MHIISLPTSYYLKYCHKGWQEQSQCMGWINSHSTNRYSYESCHTSRPRSTSDIWSCQKPDLHGHLQQAHQLSNCNDSSWSSRHQGVFSIPKHPHRFNWSIRFIADGFYNLATAIVFSSTASVSSWEAFR